MFSISWAFERLTESALMSLILSVLGSAAVLCCRQPVRRMRIIVMTLAACLLAPLFNLIPGLPHWSLPRTVTATAVATSASRRPPTDTSFPSQSPPDSDRIPMRNGHSVASLPEPSDLDPALVVELPEDETDGRIVASEPIADALPPAHSAPSPSTMTQPVAIPQAIDLRVWTVGTYLAGLAGFMTWWLAGLVGLRRVLREARPAPESCRNILREIAGPAGDRVRLLVSSRATQPFTFGWRRPVIVLPENMSKATDAVAHPFRREAQPSALASERELQWCLAHEWAHVARGDSLVWSLAGVARTVYYYQPLCWWLRTQLRLCQDYLADAAAARESSPDTYAAFLAARAAGRPLAIGLGIASGKSDLYRRVAMLVQNHRILETRCPFSWTACAAIAAMTIVVGAATFSRKSEAGAGSKPAPVLATQDGTSQSDGRRPETATREVNADADRTLTVAGTRTDGIVQNSAKEVSAGAKEASDRVKPAADAALQKLVDGLFTRATAIKSGRFSIKRQQIENGKVVLETPAECVVSGDSWRERPRPAGNDVRVNHGGRLLTLREMPATARSSNVPPRPSYELTIGWPQSIVNGAATDAPVYAGTIWYPATLPYLKEHTAAARLVRAETVNGIETQVVEWPVRPGEVNAAFWRHNDLLSGGGIYRVYLAPQLGYTVPRIEFVDRFATPQFVFDFSEFKELAAGLWFPMKIRLQEHQEKGIVVLEVAGVNVPIDEREFAMRIPRGTHVQDLRPYRGARRDALGKLILPSGPPLREFTTGAEYPEGLPAAMLAEMDRDVISPEESRREETAPAAATEPADDESEAAPRQPAGEPTGPQPVPRFNQGQLLYGGKGFQEWSIQLLIDLEPDTRVKALAAMGAFAANGYADRVAAAIGEALNNDDSTLKHGKVQEAACAALECCGAAGVPVLARQLENESIQSRKNAVLALAKFAGSTDGVIPALLAAANDSATAVRQIAFQALATRFLTDPAAGAALALAVHDEESVRFSTVQALRDSTAPANQIIALVGAFLDDGDPAVRGTAAAVFAARAPATPENAMLLKTAVFEMGFHGRDRFVGELLRLPQKTAIEAELAVPPLVALLESEETYRHVDGTTSDQIALNIIDVVGKLAQEKPAQAAIPVLIKAIREELPKRFLRYTRGIGTSDLVLIYPQFVLKAAETLGRLGPAARPALPALKRLLEPGRIDGAVLSGLRLETEKQWQSRIESVIRKIEDK
jgi:beta-lactamase regulating signal transducer with metallopeptidase domain